MKKSLKIITLSGIVALTVPVLLSLSKNAKSVSAYSTSSLPTTIDLNDTSASDIRSYYSSLNNLSDSERQGTNLLKNLKTILKNDQKYYAYDGSNDIWKIYEITDRDWDKSPASSTTYGTYNSSTNKITNYTYGTSSSSSKNNPYIHALYINRDVTNQTTAWDDHQQTQWGINREHVWPKAEGFENSGAGGARGDPMHLMAGNGYANNIHSNYYYGYVKTSSSYTDCGTKYSNQSGNLRGTSKTVDSGTVFEPQDCDKGDIARAIFYMVARYNYLSGSDSDGIDSNNPNLALTQSISDWASSGYSSTTSKTGKMGIMTDLLAWHHADPVDEYEIHRNNLLYTNFTNNRNPFIDFPEWAEFIWGKTTNGVYSSSSTGSATPSSATPSTDTINGYNSGGTTVSVTGVSLNKSSTSITVGGAETLEATVAPANATNKSVTWTSSNNNVATVGNGTVRGVSEGSATITVTTSDGGFTATCTVTVTAAPTPDPGSSVSDVLFAKGFGGYITSSYSAGGTDYTAVANSTNSTGSTYALQVFNGSTGAVRGNKSGSNNFSARNTTTYSGYYISSVSLTVSGGTLDGSTSNRSVVYFGNAAYSNPTTAPTGTSTAPSPSSSGQATLTWTNSSTSNNYFILYNLKTSDTAISADASTALTITWSPVSASTKTLDSISLDTSDTQTTFNVGDTFSYEGLSVTANYDDGSSDIVTPTTVSTPDMSTAGQKTVTVTYTEDDVTKTATYNITVNAVTLASIEVSNAKIDYYVGDTFVKPTVTATYSNGSTSDVTNSATFTGYNLSNAGNQTVTFSYNNVLTQTTSYNITVTAVTVTSIDVANPKTLFSVGDSFSFGGTVTAHYNNGSSQDVTASATFSGYNMSTAGNQTVTVSYGGQSTTYQITVSSSSVAAISIQDYASAHSWSNGTKYSTIEVDQIITATASGGANDGKYYTSGYEWRFYQTGPGSLTISCEDGYTIDTITITYVIANTGIFKDSSNNDVESDVSQTINATSATFTVGNTSSATNGQAKVTAITVTYHSSASPMTGITATVSKTYKVGETISASDLTVKGDNGQTVTGFSFANDGYQFTYADAAGGGVLTSKTFADAVTYQSFTASLTVEVSREAYVTPTGTSLTITSSSVFNEIGCGNNNIQSCSVTKGGINYEYYKSYYYSGGSALSFGNASNQQGYMKNATAFAAGISNVTVTSSGRIINIRYSTDGSNWVLKANADTSKNDYKYLKVDCIGVSGSNYSNITEIAITFKPVDTAVNVSNYIMYEDINNQCTTKFSIASGYFNNMSASERAIFMNSSDYVIATARERFEAWARHLDKTIAYSNGDYTIENSRVLNTINSTISDNTTLIVVIVSVIMGGIAIGGYFFIRKKKYQ